MQRFKKILCVVEQGEASRPALDRAVALAEKNQASLTVVDIIPLVPAGIRMGRGAPISSDLQAAMERQHQGRMLPLIEPYLGRIDIQTRVLHGATFLEVIREVLRNGHDLVIKCPESPDWLDRLFTGDDMHLLRKCPCPVWLVKRDAPDAYRRILAAVDADMSYLPEELDTRYQLNEKILEIAASMAVADSTELHIVYAWNSITELAHGLGFSSDMSTDQLESGIEKEQLEQERLLDSLVRKVMARSESTEDALDYLKPRTHLLQGPARREIPALAKRLAVDCIVMGTVARTGIRGFFIGNTAETILEQTNCSVLAVKPQGFVTPVTLEDN
jgi:nucleotide-binding universal stress UspA family protein